MNLLTNVKNRWLIIHSQPQKSESKKGETSKQEIKKEPVRWKPFFNNPQDYTMIIDILIARKLLSPLSIWVDDVGGHKGLLVVIIKYVHSQGFYKGYIMPRSKEIQEICHNDFGIDLSMSTIQHKHYDSIPIDYIPKVN